jgi:hypothetical protein
MALANLKPIKLYSLATPNGVRVSTFFEDLKNEYSLPYECVLVLVVPFPWAFLTECNIQSRGDQDFHQQAEGAVVPRDQPEWPHVRTYPIRLSPPNLT